MVFSARSLLALVQRVQQGSVPAQHLQHALEGAAARIAKAILPAPRSPMELQSLRDPSFEHCGHKLEELGRALVERLSEELDTSELLCWELLLRENELATEAAPTPTELALRAKQSYHDEREHMLLLLLDCFKLSLLDPATNPAQPAATAFIAKLEQGGGGGAAASAAGLGALSMQLLRAVAAAATTPAGLPSDPHRRKELTQACVCLFFVCYAQQRPPPAVAAGLCSLLRTVSSPHLATPLRHTPTHPYSLIRVVHTTPLRRTHPFYAAHADKTKSRPCTRANPLVSALPSLT